MRSSRYIHTYMRTPYNVHTHIPRSRHMYNYMCIHQYLLDVVIEVYLPVNEFCVLINFIWLRASVESTCDYCCSRAVSRFVIILTRLYLHLLTLLILCSCTKRHWTVADIVSYPWPVSWRQQRLRLTGLRTICTWLTRSVSALTLFLSNPDSRRIFLVTSWNLLTLISTQVVGKSETICTYNKLIFLWLLICYLEIKWVN